MKMIPLTFICPVCIIININHKCYAVAVYDIPMFIHPDDTIYLKKKCLEIFSIIFI